MKVVSAIRFLTASLLMQMALPAYALETDNYLVWGHELNDVSPQINQFMDGEVQRALEISNRKSSPQTCQQVTDEIGSRFKTYLVHDDPIATWLLKNLKAGEMFPAGINYVQDSIYREPFRFYIPAFGLAPNIQIRQFYFGMDKLSHFASTGKDYFNIYVKELAQGRSGGEATQRAILYGIKDENSVHGFWASGVLSYADLEANYQGLQFYKRLCLEGNGSFLTQLPNKKWALTKAIDISPYVNPRWDETFELSYRLPKNWEKVRLVIKEKYCSMSSNRAVQARMDYYLRSDELSFSRGFIQELQAARNPKVPRPEDMQSVDGLCH